mmetsp:Transcript_47614/g.86069  ORF Transcript_47614/g.86069 Transcript_47614/m.86069 type:complete len:83 (-) Transcript_47614:14-262(-)
MVKMARIPDPAPVSCYVMIDQQECEKRCDQMHQNREPFGLHVVQVLQEPGQQADESHEAEHFQKAADSSDGARHRRRVRGHT